MLTLIFESLYGNNGGNSMGLVMPNIFTDDISLIDATTTNANNQYILNNIQNTLPQYQQPTNTTQATFGGVGIAYTFPSSLTVNGPITENDSVSGGPLTSTFGSASQCYTLIATQDIATGYMGVGSGGMTVNGPSAFIGPMVVSSVNFSGPIVGQSTLNLTGALTGTTGAFTGNLSTAAQLLANTGAFSGAVSMGALTATTGAFSGAVSMGALTATTGTFSGAVTVTGTLGVTSAFTANGSVIGGITLSSGSMSVPGSITAAGAINANGGISAVGSTIGGVVLLSNAVGATSTITAGAGFISQAAAGFSMANASTGGNTVLGTGGGSIAGVPAQAFYVYTPGGNQQLAVDNLGDFGIFGSLAVNGRLYANTSSTQSVVPPVYSGPNLIGLTNGGGINANVHITIGSVAQSSGAVTVTLAGAAAFTSANTYWVCVSNNAAGGGNTGGAYATPTSGTTFIITNSAGFGTASYIAIGY